MYKSRASYHLSTSTITQTYVTTTSTRFIVEGWSKHRRGVMIPYDDTLACLCLPPSALSLSLSLSSLYPSSPTRLSCLLCCYRWLPFRFSRHLIFRVVWRLCTQHQPTTYTPKRKLKLISYNCSVTPTTAALYSSTHSDILAVCRWFAFWSTKKCVRIFCRHLSFPSLHTAVPVYTKYVVCVCVCVRVVFT